MVPGASEQIKLRFTRVDLSFKKNKEKQDRKLATKTKRNGLQYATFSSYWEKMKTEHGVLLRKGAEMTLEKAYVTLMK